MSVKPLKPTTHLIFWGCASILFMLVIMLFKSVLLPFVLGIAVAYLLNPIVNKFDKIGIARAPAAIMILAGFLILILGFIGVISPILYRELSQFSDDLPNYIEKFWGIMSPVTARLDQYIDGQNGESLEALLKQNAGSAVGVANYIMQKFASGGQAVMDVISVAIFMPIVAYFMMKEWPNVTKWVQDLMPRHSEGVIMELLEQINAKLSGFVRGQITVAVFLGVAYAIALSIAGLKYGILIGLVSGLLSVIPMVGSVVGLIVGVAVAWFQAGDLMFASIIAAIFIGGQLIEGNFLTPKLVGDSVGLHPLWVFFSLLAGGALLGILGMFLAVPVAAVIGVLLAFAIKKYKQSAYYKESENKPAPKAKSKPKPKSKPKAKKRKRENNALAKSLPCTRP